MNLTFLNKNISLKSILISVILSNSVTYYFITKKEQLKSEQTIAELNSNSTSSSSSNRNYSVKRLAGFDYINPILFVDDDYESDKLNTIKQSFVSLQ